MKPTGPGDGRRRKKPDPHAYRGPFLVAKNRAGHVLLTPCESPQPGAAQFWLRTRPAARG